MGLAGTAGPVWEGASDRRFIRLCRRRYLWLLSRERATVLSHPQTTPGLEQSSRVSWRPHGSTVRPWTVQPWGPRGVFGGVAGWPGDGPSAGTPPPSPHCRRDHLPGACLQNGDGAPGHPSPCRARLKMSATKDRTQGGLSRNKGQVLAWDDGRG